MTPCINLYPTTACDAKNNNRKQNTIASYAMKKFGIEYQGFLLRFCTHRNYFNCVFRSTKLRKYAIRSLIWSYADNVNFLLYSHIFIINTVFHTLPITSSGCKAALCTQNPRHEKTYIRYQRLTFIPVITIQHIGLIHQDQ